MKSKHDLLKQTALQSLSDIFSDKSVDRATTKDSLEEIRDEIGTMLDALKEDQTIDKSDD